MLLWKQSLFRSKLIYNIVRVYCGEGSLNGVPSAVQVGTQTTNLIQPS